MAFDAGTAQRVREAMQDITGVVERKMFGGLAFMVHGNMCVGVIREELMVRVGPEQYDHALALPFARKMDFTGKPLKGFVYVAAPGFSSDTDLGRWIEVAYAFVRTLPKKIK